MNRLLVRISVLPKGDFFGFYLFVWLCMGLIYISGLVLGLISTVID